jgi:hypothetical protein
MAVERVREVRVRRSKQNRRMLMLYSWAEASYFWLFSKMSEKDITVDELTDRSESTFTKETQICCICWAYNFCVHIRHCSAQCCWGYHNAL